MSDENTPNPPEKQIFLTQKEKDEFLNSERDKIRKQEEAKIKDKISNLQEQLKTKGEPQMNEAQIAEIVQKVISENLDTKLGDISKVTQEQMKKLEQQLTTESNQRRMERLQDILDTERGRYKEDELVEELLPETLTGEETPEQIRAAVKKAHEVRMKYKTAPSEDNEEGKEKPKSKEKDQEKVKEKEKPTSEPEKVPAPGVTTSSSNNIPPNLDNTTEEAKALEEMTQIKDSKTWKEQREKYAKIFGRQ